MRSNRYSCLFPSVLSNKPAECEVVDVSVAYIHTGRQRFVALQLDERNVTNMAIVCAHHCQTSMLALGKFGSTSFAILLQQLANSLSNV